MNADKQLMFDLIDTKEFRLYAKKRLDYYNTILPPFYIGGKEASIEKIIKINLKNLDYKKYYDTQTNSILRVIIKGFYKIKTGGFYEKKITKDTMIFAINNLTF